MEKLLGILPYLYFEEPIQLGEVTFIGVPDWQGRDLMPSSEADKKSLHELYMCFFPHWGFRTEKGSIKATTYFLLGGTKMAEQELFKACQKAVTLLRYALLWPDNQSISDIESTFLYLFALPPVGSGEYRVYRGWQNMNQELWVSPKDDRSIYPPDGGVSMREVNTSQLEDIDVIKDCFYGGKISDERQSEVLLAMEWYNQSFQKYSISNIAACLVDVATAFETLFQLPQWGKKKEFKKRIGRSLCLEGNSVMEQWAIDFYGHVRSETLHSGKPLSFLFKHPDAQSGHLSFLWSAQRIFRECVSAEIGLPRHIPNDRLIEELTPNEVHLTNLSKAGSFEKILEGGLLGEVGKLRQIYPVGKREDIIWLGKELLRAYKGKFLVNEEQSLPTLDLILSAKDDDNELGLLYYQFSREFRPLAHKYVTVFWGEVSESELKKPMPITSGNFEQFQLESAIYHFAKFAGWALLIPA
jgi:hypothetical protein